MNFRRPQMDATKFLSERIVEVAEFRKSLTSESDRGSALMAASFLDEQLKKLLARSFVDDEKLAAELLGTSSCLGTFSSRIDMAYALGHYGIKTRKDLHIIRKIRNDFGHNASPLDFKNQSIAGRCRELKTTHHSKNAAPRSQFTNAVHGVLAAIHAATYKAVHPPIGPDLDVSNDSSFFSDAQAVQQTKDWINKLTGKKVV